ncbi:MAG: class I SAM-dependent methyltransferase [Anaerolineales bacterium]|nr:class I SAM-dependent methyltransferase [Anaerolineales bacterium]
MITSLKRFFEQNLPETLIQRLMPVRIAIARIVRAIFSALGYNVTRKNDYYAPLPNLKSLQNNAARWQKASSLPGIDYDLGAFKTLLRELTQSYTQELTQLPAYPRVQKMGFGPGYTAIDAQSLYMIIRQFKPARYIEIGSGISTYYCHLAAKKNRADGYPLQIECIEPYPYAALTALPGIQLQKQEVQNIDPAYFEQLTRNDILFIDSSHVLKIDGDVAYLYLEILPRLKPGVLIHIHDIPFPYNYPYPPEFWINAAPWPKYWNEAMVLQAFLAFNASFQVILSTPLLRYFDEPFLRQTFLNYQPVTVEPNTFSSIWLQRVR